MNIPKAPRFAIGAPRLEDARAYVLEHAEPGDLVYDPEEIGSRLMVGLVIGLECPFEIERGRLVGYLRDAFCEWVGLHPDFPRRVFVIAGNVMLAQRYASVIGGDLVWKDGDTWKVTTIKREI